jgi:hypothetical protein
MNEHQVGKRQFLRHVCGGAALGATMLIGNARAATGSKTTLTAQQALNPPVPDYLSGVFLNKLCPDLDRCGGV